MGNKIHKRNPQGELSIVIKRNYFALFLLFLAASVTLTACDSNEAEDTEVEVEVVETETETTVDVSAPEVQDIAAQVTTGALAAVVGDNVAVDNSAGAITQVSSTATSTPSTGGSSTTTSTTATVAPLVNTTTGQPTGQVAISVTQSSSGAGGSATTTQTAIVTPNTSNTAAIQVAATTNTGSSTATTLNQTFNIASITASNQGWLNIRNTLRQRSGINFANRVSPNGQTWGARIQAAIAAGKRRNLAAELGSYQLGSFTSLANAVGAAYDACRGSQSSVTSANLSYGGTNVTVDCSWARTGATKSQFISTYS